MRPYIYEEIQHARFPNLQIRKFMELKI